MHFNPINIDDSINSIRFRKYYNKLPLYPYRGVRHTFFPKPPKPSLFAIQTWRKGLGSRFLNLPKPPKPSGTNTPFFVVSLIMHPIYDKFQPSAAITRFRRKWGNAPHFTQEKGQNTKKETPA